MAKTRDTEKAWGPFAAGTIQPNPMACYTCSRAYRDMEDKEKHGINLFNPYICSCLVYKDKPDDIYWKGRSCEKYQYETNLNNIQYLENWYIQKFMKRFKSKESISLIPKDDNRNYPEKVMQYGGPGALYIYCIRHGFTWTEALKRQEQRYGPLANSIYAKKLDNN